MNWSRGFFRLWALFAVFWVCGITIGFWSDVRDEFTKSRNYNRFSEYVMLLPVECSKARGAIGVDYTADEKGPWVDHGGKHICWYEEPKFRAQFPEYADIPQKELTRRIYAEVGQPLNIPEPWLHLGIAIFHALFWPLVLLVIGLALRWVLIGFRV